MISTKRTGRVTGLLFLVIFVLGIIAYQILQGPILFSDDFLSSTAANSKIIIISTLILFLSGITSIVIASLLLPIFKKHSIVLAFLYLAFTILGFIMISIDNIGVLSILELSQTYMNNETDNSDVVNTLALLLNKRHWWTHYMSLLISCLPVFILYYTMFRAELIPKPISVFGITAVILMFIEIIFSIMGDSISMNMLLPIGIVQLVFPLWLIFKGFNSSAIKIES